MKPKDEIDIDALRFDCECPKCGHESERTASFIRQYTQYCCPNCSAVVPKFGHQMFGTPTPDRGRV